MRALPSTLPRERKRKGQVAGRSLVTSQMTNQLSFVFFFLCIFAFFGGV